MEGEQAARDTPTNPPLSAIIAPRSTIPHPTPDLIRSQLHRARSPDAGDLSSTETGPTVRSPSSGGASPDLAHGKPPCGRAISAGALPRRQLVGGALRRADSDGIPR